MNPLKSPLVPLPATRCQHLRCKGMGVFGDGYLTPEDERARTTDFWCLHTHNVLGPDGDLVMLSRCVAGRGCHEPL